MHNGIIILTLGQLTVRKTNNVHTQLGHFHAVMGQVPLTGNPTPGPLKCRTKIMRWRRNCPSGSVEMTTDAHDLINVISSLLCAVLCLKLESSGVRGESKCALCIGCEKCVNGWENLARHCLCLEGMMPGGLTKRSVPTVTSTFLPPCLFWNGYSRKKNFIPLLHCQPILLRQGFLYASGLGADLHTSYTVKISFYPAASFPGSAYTN